MDLASVFDGYAPQSAEEAADVERVRRLVASGDDPWTRASPLHVTGSAVVVHPPTFRVLLRWHERQQNWLQVGGHADPGETDPFAVAIREAAEETGLRDLVPWPDGAAAARPAVIHVVIVPVPAGKGEPDHEHADVRYVLATAAPDSAMPEDAGAPLRWLSIDDAIEWVGTDNLRVTLQRLAVAVR
jgi:8-oxo-dGTP pyrophosphatase MutT (NUDIX family)